ncbi:MAG: lipopolysaccharide biosynthesis protein [Gaiella sp.]
MRSRLFWRRAATGAGLYLSVALGILATVVVARRLGLDDFGVFATALAAASFFQVLLDLTVEDALTKVGFRYVAAQEWGKLRRLFHVATRLKLLGGVLAALALVLLAPVADDLFDADGLTNAMLVAALIPLAQCTENVSTSALLLRGRYDLRGAYQTLTQGLKLAAVAVGARYGVVETLFGIVLAQAVSTASVWFLGRAALRRFPAAPETWLGADRAEIQSFVLRSSLATGVVSARTTLAPLILGLVAGPTQVGLLRIAQAPQSGFSAASSPVRLILLTEQTRDWEHGHRARVFEGVSRYMRWALGVVVVAVPVFLVAMPWLVDVVFGDEYAAAVDAARIVLLAAAIYLVLGWTKSFPTTVGRPGLRILSHGIETVALLPLTAVFGALWGATGAAVAILVAAAVFAVVWAILLVRLRAESAADRAVGEGAGEAIAS